MGQKQSILIVDDDPHILEVLEARLTSAEYEVFTAGEADAAMDILAAQKVDLMISDVRMPGKGGLDLLKEARALYPGLPVIFLTAYGTIPDAVSAIKAGAIEYFTKPFKGRDLVLKVQDTLKSHSGGSGQVAGAGPSCLKNGASNARDILRDVRSPAMLELHELIERVAPTTVNVLILGESGVGKERIAHMIHDKGPRRDNPFIVVDCGSTPTGLLESELFGHVRGSFTHAVRDKKGLIEAAEHGTLFLDEIGNISPEMQTRLLRFLEERKIRRIGDIKEIQVDCRVISATNVDLPEEVESGSFREDLYYRLRVVTLKIPPLRDRKEDIPLLARHFVTTFAKAQGLPEVKVPTETIDWIVEYPWPGNVRELKNALEAAVVLCRDGVLRPSDLHLAGLPERPHLAVSSVSSPAAGAGGPLSLEENERNAIVRALDQAGGVQKDAADLLGISRRTLHYKIKKFGIEVSGRRQSEN
ncbi:MAG: sigma-54-dependent transcriptional regulator [Syntrophobacteraceae bacterium]